MLVFFTKSLNEFENWTNLNVQNRNSKIFFEKKSLKNSLPFIMEVNFLEEFSKFVTINFFTEKKALKNGFKNKIFQICKNGVTKTLPKVPKSAEKCRFVFL